MDEVLEEAVAEDDPNFAATLIGDIDLDDEAIEVVDEDLSDAIEIDLDDDEPLAEAIEVDDSDLPFEPVNERIGDADDEDALAFLNDDDPDGPPMAVEPESQPVAFDPLDAPPGALNPAPDGNVVSNVTGSVADIVGPVLGTGAAMAATGLVMGGGKQEVSDPPDDSIDVDDGPTADHADSGIATIDEDEDDLIEVEVDELDDQHVAFADEANEDGEDLIQGLYLDDDDNNDGEPQAVSIADSNPDPNDFEDLSFDDTSDRAALAIDSSSDTDEDVVEEEEPVAKKRGGLFSLFGLLGGRKKKAAVAEPETSSLVAEASDAGIDVVDDLDEDMEMVSGLEVEDVEVSELEPDLTETAVSAEVYSDELNDGDLDNDMLEFTADEVIPEIDVGEPDAGGVDLAAVVEEETDELADDALDAFEDISDDAVVEQTAAIPMPDGESEDDAFSYLLDDDADDENSLSSSSDEMTDFLSEFED